MNIEKNFTETDVVNGLTNPVLSNQKDIDYAKSIQIYVQEYVELMVNKLAGADLLINLDYKSELHEEFNYGNNGPGFDRLHFPTKKRIQIKFRQTKGTTPYSRQLDIETTRRKSNKNINKSETGHVSYSTDEFDYILFVISHNLDGRPHFKNWNYSLVPATELEDVNKKGNLVTKVHPALLSENKCDNIYMLTDKLKNLK